MYRSERAETSDETEYMYTVYNSKQDGATTYISSLRCRAVTYSRVLNCAMSICDACDVKYMRGEHAT